MERRRFKELEGVVLSLALGLLAAGTELACSAPRPSDAVSGKLEKDYAPYIKKDPKEIRGELSATKVIDGSILLATVEVPSPAKELVVEGRFGETVVPFYEEGPEGTRFHAIIGVPYQFTPGLAEIQITVKRDGEEKVLRLPFEVEAGDYPSEALSVDPRKIHPTEADLIRIQHESEEIGAIYRQVSREKRWEGPFALPISSPVTSSFGIRRVFNGEMKSFHNGLDLKAKIGTRVKAPAAGVVVLAKDLFYTGKTVLLDHGYGLFTVYGHMSKLKVKKGQMVKARQVLGLSGKTGRASGPHLHWGAIVHRTKVNPLELTRALQ